MDASPETVLTLQATDDSNTNLSRPSAHFGQSTGVFRDEMLPLA